MCIYQVALKMLGRYFYILIIGKKSNIMLSISNKLILQKELHNNVFLDKKRVKTQQQQNKKSNIKNHKGALGTSCTQRGCLTTALHVSIVVRLFNCCDPMGRNVNKTPNLQATHFQLIHIFYNIFT